MGDTGHRKAKQQHYCILQRQNPEHVQYFELYIISTWYIVECGMVGFQMSEQLMTTP